jgi:antagonist of KipI
MRGRGSTSATLRVLVDRASGVDVEALDALLAGTYTVGPESNRMGLRFDGPPLRVGRSADIAPEITPLGTIQVPASGQPILLMSDRQTTGGYAPLAVVATVDIPHAAQLAPGDTVRFALWSHDEARAALRAHERSLNALEQALAGGGQP